MKRKMLTTTHFFPSTQPGRQRGVAIGVILTAIALTLVLGIALVAANFTNTGYANRPKDDTYAAALIAQARNIRAGIDMMTGRGIPISSITFGTSGTTALFDPQYGGAEIQPPIPGARSSTTTGWVWKVDANGNPTVKLYNVGINSNPDYVAILPNIDYETCSNINSQLNNDGSIWHMASNSANYIDLTTPARPVDLSFYAGHTFGHLDGCYLANDGTWPSATSMGGSYVFIVTIRAQ